VAEQTYPVIAVTASGYEPTQRVTRLGLDYSGGVERAGGLAYVVPVPHRLREGPRDGAERLAAEAAARVLGAADGLLLTGGPDLDPETFGEDPIPQLGRVDAPRDVFELALAAEALSRGLPLLGICRGAQVLAVAAGGTLYQDLAAQRPGCLKHRQNAARATATHFVDVEPGSLLARLLGTVRVKVNSFHHQAVAELPPGFAASALAPDGVVEALEPAAPSTAGPARGARESGWALGVQWHPENMWSTDPVFLGLFTGLVQAARSYGCCECAGRRAASDD